jgi:hypothetical protein
MKPLFTVAFVLLAGVCLSAQEVAPSGQPTQGVEVQTPRAPATNIISTNILSEAKQPDERLKPLLTYSGLGKDIAKSTNRWRMFSLRKAANVKEDDANLIRNIRTEAGPAIKLFSIDF